MASTNSRGAFLKILYVTSIVAPVWGTVAMMPARGAEVPAAPATDARIEPADRALSVEEFDRLHREVKPPAQEVWRSIPWKTSILAAVAEARQVGKPILLITTNGHLLGCG